MSSQIKNGLWRLILPVLMSTEVDFRGWKIAENATENASMTVPAEKGSMTSEETVELSNSFCPSHLLYHDCHIIADFIPESKTNYVPKRFVSFRLGACSSSSRLDT